MSYKFYTIKLATEDDLNYGIKEITETRNDKPILSFKVDDKDIETDINSTAGFIEFSKILKRFIERSNAAYSKSDNVIRDDTQNNHALVPVEKQDQDKEQVSQPIGSELAPTSTQEDDESNFQDANENKPVMDNNLLIETEEGAKQDEPTSTEPTWRDTTKQELTGEELYKNQRGKLKKDKRNVNVLIGGRKSTFSKKKKPTNKYKSFKNKLSKK